MHPPIVESYKLHSLWLSMREEQATSKHCTYSNTIE
jgi:hypothetical protein